MGQAQYGGRRSRVKFTDIQKSTKPSRSSSMKKYVVYAIILITVSVLMIVLSRIERPSVLGDQQNATGAGELVEVETSRYFIVQTSHKDLTNNITLEDLKKSSLAALPAEVPTVKAMLSQEEITEITDEDVYSWYKNGGFEGYVVVPLENADFRLKTLNVDDIMIWNTNSSADNYPLVRKETRQYSIEELSNAAESNFDKSKMVTYVAGGEVIPARAVARKFRRTEDYTFPFHNVKELFAGADFSSILLENSISGRPEPCYGCAWFIGDEQFIEGLEYLGVDFVATSGNHIGDGQIPAIARTREVLTEANITHTGASENNQAEASKPAVVDVDGFNIAFLAYDDVAYYHWAGDNYGGVAKISDRSSDGTKTLLSEKIKQDVDAAKEVGDYVIVIISWGAREYINWPLDYQREAGHTFIDAGADLIVGTHQHWVGAIEFYNGKPIFYGLGNFVFDQTHTDPTRQGAFVKYYYYDKKLVNFSIIPQESCGPQQSVADNDSCNHFQPYYVREGNPAYKVIMQRVLEYSDI